MRVKGDPAAMLPMLAREVNRVDPDVPIAETTTLPLQIAGGLRSLRITASFVSYAAAWAVLLSAIGLYGALAFSVSRRTREIGIRMALGAESTEVLAMVIREGMTVILFGVATGLGLAVAATSVVRHLLYGSGAADAPMYAAAVLLLACVGLFACWVPARRAASVEPMVALRDERRQERRRHGLPRHGENWSLSRRRDGYAEGGVRADPPIGIRTPAGACRRGRTCCGRREPADGPWSRARGRGPRPGTPATR